MQFYRLNYFFLFFCLQFKFSRFGGEIWAVFVRFITTDTGCYSRMSFTCHWPTLLNHKPIKYCANFQKLHKVSLRWLRRWDKTSHKPGCAEKHSTSFLSAISLQMEYQREVVLPVRKVPHRKKSSVQRFQILLREQKLRGRRVENPQRFVENN